ncbi:hypothetical protein H4R33_001705 [Dimargaris cristalligena]|uniref:GTP-binding protein 8 n=1 Tax=Dimargaris cristalligena TaxID=215637 RepID=A0A4P9ZZ68_9FUNG|nr:hypothetical protein H4R33_001705 [Dimargaris cristalligena]RKP39055.1 P-loop containing nucleoside triphosphate hydrolase protein [Dimargaris cristalligena]|eukprot:RKP39055.1 P-loop containing nucleoside triphosphate hydrolase protein [Dimargaris cristalligena]
MATTHFARLSPRCFTTTRPRSLALGCLPKAAAVRQHYYLPSPNLPRQLPGPPQHRWFSSERERPPPTESFSEPYIANDPQAPVTPSPKSLQEDLLNQEESKATEAKKQRKRRALLYAAKTFQKPAYLICPAVSVKQAQHLRAPEVVFLGRSNVGKSSLINALFRQEKLARTSKQPGSTAQMFFYSLGSMVPQMAILTLVDMPGYGYRSRPEWGEFINEYLKSRDQLRGAYLLIDANIGELKASDIQVIETLNYLQVPFQVILTKIDKVKDTTKVEAEITRKVRALSSYFQEPVFLASSRRAYEMAELRLNILVTCRVAKAPN